MVFAAVRALLVLALVGLSGHTASGCGGSSDGVRLTTNGGGAPSAATPATLRVQNDSSALLEVSLGDTPMGQVPPRSSAHMDVVPGSFAVYLREVQEPFRRYYGHWALVSGATAVVTYAPGTSFNLEVVNRARVGLQVLVDGVEVTRVAAGEQRDVWIAPGPHEVQAREEFQTRLIALGTWDFPAAGSGLPAVRLYY